VPTWQEHLRQHDGRLTGEDKAIEETAFACIVGSPRTHHLFPSETQRNSLSVQKATQENRDG